MPDTKITKDAALAALGLTEDDLMQAHILINDGLAIGGFKAGARQRLAHASKRFLRAFEAQGPVVDTVRDAAPGLLEALRGMLEVFGGHEEGDVPAEDAAHAAIAKAEGR